LDFAKPGDAGQDFLPQLAGAVRKALVDRGIVEPGDEDERRLDGHGPPARLRARSGRRRRRSGWRRLTVDRVQRRQETIAAPVHALDITRRPRFIAERPAQLLDHRGQRGFTDDRAVPDVGKQRLLGEQPALLFDQRDEHAVGLVPDLQRAARPVHSLVGPVEDEVAEPHTAAVTISAQIHRFAPVCGNSLPRRAGDHQSARS
jgi:hypothetical protein